MQRLRDAISDEEEIITSLRLYKNKIVQFVESFLFRNHYVSNNIMLNNFLQCFVFELLGKNLYYDIKDNNFEGFKIDKVRDLSFQIIQGLIYIRHCDVVHCDLKPENLIYADSRRKDLKIIDFGSSCSKGLNAFTYVQSRFYRAPEVVMGLPYDYQVDMWSLGCIIAELFCGRPIFPA